ncbi:unnamed protein product [Closterium sp. Naga37s-1]|nr:unnamed protein product [Closterium sp. Naga37s-1]
MEQSSGNENSGPANTTPNTSVPSTSTQPDPHAAAPETQESQIQNQPPANAQTPTTTTNTQVDWWVYHIPSPTASYDADDDYGLGADMDNAATLGEVEEEPAEQETSPTRETTAPSRRSTGRTQPRWTPEEECEVLAAFITRQARIRARTGQQGRSWYPLIQEELLLKNPTWRHDISALKAKYNRMKEQWRRINDRIKRSGAGRATGLPPWYHLGDALWDTIPSASPTAAATESGATTGVSIRGRRQVGGALASSDGQEGCSRHAWYQYPRQQPEGKDGKGGKTGSKGQGRKSAGQSRAQSTADLVRELRDHNDKRQEENWGKFEALTREVFRGFADERRSRRRSPPLHPKTRREPADLGAGESKP